MLTANEAFRKFRSNLELTQKEQDDASRRQKEIRGVMDDGFNISEDFLTGSYRRWTKTKPLKDVDIFCVLHNDEKPKYRDGKQPGVLLGAVEQILAAKYGSSCVSRQRRAVTVEFSSGGDDERVVSFDVVPAFAKGDHYEIPDTATTSGWTNTNPKIHAEKATAANNAFGGEWKGMVRMAKSWNRANDKPVRPSFLLEVMALEILRPPFGGDFPYEFMSYFATAADRIDEVWPDPAGLGPPVNDTMTASDKAKAKQALINAHHKIREAIQLSRTGRSGDSLRAYRELFGQYFPLS